jgi:hypothetical protein
MIPCFSPCMHATNEDPVNINMIHCAHTGEVITTESKLISCSGFIYDDVDYLSDYFGGYPTSRN